MGVSTHFYMFMNLTKQSMTSIGIENHLRNQINSLNKEIHTKQGIIEKQRYYLKQYMEFSTKYRDELKRARKDRLKITNEFLDVVKLLQRQVSKLNAKVPNCPVCLKQYRSDSIYCLRSCGHTICGSCSQLLTARCHMCRSPFNIAYDLIKIYL